MKVGLIFGKFAPLTAGHVNFIRMAVESGIDRLYLFLSFDQKFNNTQTPWMQERLGLEARLLDLKRLIEDSGLNHKVIVNYVDESNIPGYPDGAKAYADLIRAKIPEGEILTHAFSSEPEYTEYFSEHFPEVEHVVLDAERSGVKDLDLQFEDMTDQYWGWDNEAYIVYSSDRVDIEEDTGEGYGVEVRYKKDEDPNYIRFYVDNGCGDKYDAVFDKRKRVEVE